MWLLINEIRNMWKKKDGQNVKNVEYAKIRKKMWLLINKIRNMWWLDANKIKDAWVYSYQFYDELAVEWSDKHKHKKKGSSLNIFQAKIEDLW